MSEREPTDLDLSETLTEHRISLDFYPRSKRWVLREPITRITSFGALTVPAGMEGDLASTPWQVWKVYPKLDLYTEAALVHDMLYQERPHRMSRKEADKVFLEILLQDGVPITRARWMHSIVRTWGSKAWNA